MGGHDWIIVKRLMEAEAAGVIDIGGWQILFSVLQMKKQFKKDTCLVKNALEQVFYHQALTDERMQYRRIALCIRN